MDVDRLLKYKNIHFVNCSLNASTYETHKKIMRGPDFNKSKENTKKLIEKAPFKTRVSMVVSEDNKHEVEDFKKEWGKYATISAMANWVGARPVKQENTKVRRYCNRTIHSITVLWDGRVCTCCLDSDPKLFYGNLNEISLKQVIENMKEIREAHKKHDFSMNPCKFCNFNTL
jgi:radical SAM protein with 4Fe4S-binding SPASM domain